MKYNKHVRVCTGIADLEPYDIELPDAPPIETFVNYGLSKEKQVFKTVSFPQKLKDLDRQVKSGKKSREDAVLEVELDKELSDFVESLWLKRLTGDWQIINGVPLHISPTHWFYLNFWEMPRTANNLPEFRADFYHNSGDLQFFWFWDYAVVPNPFCDGAIEMTQRQVGKSYKLGVVLYEPTSRSYEWQSGVQSKTSNDVSAFFEKCIVKQWRKLPFFFRPIYSNSTYPKAEGLQFTPRAKKGKDDSSDNIDADELMGSIVYKSSDVSGFDGPTLDRYGADEIGKTTECDVYERWTVVREGMKRRGGKSYQTSTIEELDKKGGKFMKNIWMDSDRRREKIKPEDLKVDENGETKSGLWPWFTPSYCNEHFDKWGFSIVESISEDQKKYLKSVASIKKIKYWWMSGMESITFQIEKADNSLKRQEIIRKKPRSIREAFQSANSFSYFNLDILNKQLNKYAMGYDAFDKEIMKYGKFDWAGEPFQSKVVFVPTDFLNARFYASYFPPENMQNAQSPVPGGKMKPGNSALFRSGADPFKYDTPDVKNPKDMSKGAQHVYAFYDEQVDGGKERKDWLTNNIVYEYLYRNHAMSVDELCEDYLKACIFYGCKLYPERNNDDVIKYFKSKGYEHYIQLGMRLTTTDGGIYYKQDIVGGNVTNDKVIEKLFRHIQNFVNEDAPYCMFYRTLQDCKDVERDNLNPYDLFVSLGYTLMSAYEADIANKQIEKPHDIDISILETVFGGELNLY